MIAIIFHIFIIKMITEKDTGDDDNSNNNNNMSYFYYKNNNGELIQVELNKNNFTNKINI